MYLEHMAQPTLQHPSLAEQQSFRTQGTSDTETTKKLLWKDFYDARYALVEHYLDRASDLNIPGAKIQHGDGVVWVRNVPSSYNTALRDIGFRKDDQFDGWEKRIEG